MVQVPGPLEHIGIRHSESNPKALGLRIGERGVFFIRTSKGPIESIRMPHSRASRTDYDSVNEICMLEWEPGSLTYSHGETQQMFTKMYPELHVSDVEKAVAFFTDALGFKIGFKLEDEGVLDFAVLNHGDLMVYLHHMLPEDESDHPKRLRLYFEPLDIVELHADLRKKGYPVSDLEDETYGAGAKSCHLMGPDKYEIRFHQWNKD